MDEQKKSYKLNPNADSLKKEQQKSCKACARKENFESTSSNRETQHLLDQRFSHKKSITQQNQMNELSFNDSKQNDPYIRSLINKSYRYVGKPVLDDTFTNSH